MYLLLGDCLQKLKNVADKSVDLVICDLPYGCLTGGGGKEKAKRTIENPNNCLSGCSWDIPIDLDLFWREIKRVRKSDHTPCLMFCTTKFGYDLIKSNEKEFRYDLVWDKQRGVSFLTANKMPMRSHEMIYVFSKAGANYYRKDIEGDFKAFISGKGKSRQYGVERIQKENDGSKRCILSVIQNKSTLKGNHPTEKSIDLYKFLIERYSKEGDQVLDPTFGSGNSGLASKELNRKYIGIEKEPKFFYSAVSRLI